jgi:hypothetical protein
MVGQPINVRRLSIMSLLFLTAFSSLQHSLSYTPNLMLVSGACGYFLVREHKSTRSTTQVGKTRDVPCPATRAVSQPTPQNARRYHRKRMIKPMTNAINPIASIVRRKLSAKLRLQTRHLKFSQCRPQSSPPSHQANPSQAELSRSNWSRTNRA